MRKLSLTMCFALALGMQAFAQDGTVNQAVEKTSSAVTRLMMQSIGLNENEYLRVRTLNHARLAKAAEVTKMYGGNAEMLEARLKEIEGNFENELFKILNSRQVEAYAEFKVKPEGNFLSLVQEVAKAAKP